MLLGYDIVYLGSPYANRRWIRGLRRVSGVMTRLSGVDRHPTPVVDIRITPDGEEIPGFQPMDIRSRQLATDLLASNTDSAVVDHLAELFDREGAESYYIKGSAYYGGLRWHVLDILKLSAKHESVDHVMTPFFSGFKLDLEGCRRVETDGVVTTAYLTGRDLFTTVSVLVMLTKRYLLGETPTDAGSYRIANEVGNLSYVDGDGGQPNYLVDGDTITDEDILYYLTSHEYIGTQTKEEIDEFAAATEGFVDQRTVAPSLGECIRLATHYWRYDADSIAEMKLLRRAATVAVEFDTLYRYFDIEYDTTPMLSNDKRYCRQDSGIITALANEHGTENINYQTRPFYLYTFSHQYHSVDKHYVWSEAWVTPKRTGAFAYVDETEAVGNIHPPVESDTAASEDLVTVFPTDINSNSYMTRQYHEDLLKLTFELARSYPDYEFIWKPKFEAQSDRLLSTVQDPPANFSVEGDLYDAKSFIDRSAMIMAIGFTSPGIQAFMREKNTIYYADIGDIDGPLADAEFVCETVERVCDLFARYDEGYTVPESLYDQFDPFRDGTARDRILADLFPDEHRVTAVDQR